jgi:hypothetical protein
VDNPDAPPVEVEFEARWQCHAQRMLVHIALHGRDLPVATQLREHGHSRQVARVNDQVRRFEVLYAWRREFPASPREVRVRDDRHEHLALKLPRPKRRA